MQDRKMIKATAWVVLFATVLVVLLSSLFILEHSHHDCMGADCPICMAVEKCSDSIKLIGSAVILLAVVSVMAAYNCNYGVTPEYSLYSISLFSQKVRFNC